MPAVPRLRLSTAGDIPEDEAELASSGRFEPAVFHRYKRELSYSTEAYLDLLMTYSGHRALPDGPRNGLLSCIARLIDDRHGGQVVKRYLTELRVARRTE